MSDSLAVALIAASAAVFGGLLSAFATRSVESMRFRHALREKADERRLAAVQRFTNAAFAWFEWILYIADQGWNPERLKEQDRRSKDRQEAYRELQLLCSEELFTWLSNVYEPVEYRVRGEISEPARWGRALPPEAKDLRREYTRLLSVDLVHRFRPEIAELRDPVPRDLLSRWRDRRRVPKKE